MKENVISGLLKSIGLQEIFDFLIALGREVSSFEDDCIIIASPEVGLDDHKRGEGCDVELLDHAFSEV